MKKITLNANTINAAAKAAGKTQEEFVSSILTTSRGRKVCAHLVAVEGDSATFSYK